MAQVTTVSGLANVMKDVWTPGRIKTQFYNRNPLLKMIRDAANVTTIGLQAQVPIQVDNPQGYTSTGAAGGSLNPATATPTAQATFAMVYHYMQMGLEMATLNQTGTSAQSVVSAKDMEMKGNVDGMSRQCSRQVARNGDGIIAECDTSGGSVVVPLRVNSATVGYHGLDALQRGHLKVNMLVDIGTTADTDALVASTTVSAVDKTVTAPTITVGTSITTTAGTHFVYMANPNSATAANVELNGLENIFGTSTFGGINPASAGNDYWQGYVDTTTTSLSIDLGLALQEQVYIQDGTYDSRVVTSARQMRNFYSLLQNQVRFMGEKGMGAGGIPNLDGLTWNGVGISAMPDVYTPDWFHFMPEDLMMVRGSITDPTWVSELEGSGGDVRWVQGTTGFANAVVWPFQLGAVRRNRAASARNLVA